LYGFQIYFLVFQYQMFDYKIRDKIRI
jgi:hypothetical protein